MSLDEVEYWNDILTDRIKVKNQSKLHLFNSISFPKSLPTFYSYIKKGIFFDINDEMLPRLYSFRPRTKKRKDPSYIHKLNPVKKGRTYEDFEAFISSNPNTSIVEMDTVIGCAEDKYAILTLFFRESKLMLIYRAEKSKPKSITDIFNHLKLNTDSGWEFSKPQEIEVDFNTGEKLIDLFYCDPYRSWQKAGIERNHEFIRYIIPKGISFDSLTDNNINNMMNHINSTKRRSLDYRTPSQVFSEMFDNNIYTLLNLKHIPKEDVTLSYHILK